MTEIGALYEKLRSSSVDERLEAVRGLGSLGDLSAAKPLLELLEEEIELSDEAWRKALREAPSTELQIERHRPHGERRDRMVIAIADALGCLKASETVPRLTRLLTWGPPEQENWRERRHGPRDAAVFQALLEIGRADSAPFVALLAEPAAPHLGGQGVHRVAAVIEALGEVGDARAVEPLVALTGDVALADRAVWALEEILRRDAGSVPTGALSALRDLEDVTQNRYDRQYAGDFPRFVSQVIDCSTLRALARAEVARRGF